MPKLTWLSCLLLISSLLAVPFVGARALVNRPARRTATGMRAPAELKALSQYGTDLTELASLGKLQAVGGYDAQIERAVQTLARSAKNNPVLLGEAGSARSIIVEGIALRLANGDVPASLHGRRIFNLNLEALFADTQEQKEVRDRLAQVLSEVKDAQGEVILFVDGLDDLAREDDAGRAPLVSMLEAMLAQNELRIIGAATPESFTTQLARREGFIGKLQGIFIDEANGNPAEADTEETDDNAEDAQGGNEAFIGDKVGPELRELIQNSNSSNERVSIILQGEALKSSALQKFFRQNSIRTTGEFNNLNARAVELPARLIEQLADFDADLRAGRPALRC